MKIPSIPDSDSIAWIIAPAMRCVSFVAEQAKVGGTIARALIALAEQETLIRAARQLAIDRGATTAPIDALLREQRTLGPWAKSLVEGDYHEIHVSMLISIWSAVEVAVEDTVVLLLLREPETRKLLATAGVEVQKQLTDAPTEETARRAFRAIERRIRQTNRAGPALAAILSAVGLSLQLPAGAADSLTELNAVRNALLHRGGIADEATVRETPSLKLAEGDAIRITSPMLDKYYKATSDFAGALINGAVERFKNARSMATNPGLQADV
jgi:hypothetical protein